MNAKNLFITVVLSTLIAIAGIAYAGGGMGGGMGGDMGGGHGMMGYGPNLLNPWGSQRGTNPNYQNQRTNTERLRDEIRAKRQELSALYRSEKPDKEMINQKIAELSKLEAQLDQEMSDRY
jgi:Spy/CpxP family protein refolding chaperone